MQLARILGSVTSTLKHRSFEGERLLIAQFETATGGPEGEGGFRCQRPGCWAGHRARQLEKPPFGDEIGQRIYAAVCADCWMDWVRNYSIKVINELRLDLSTERGQEEYDRYMREFLGLE